MIVVWILIGFIIGVVASEVVDECCSDSLLWYMTLPFAYVIRPIWRGIKPLRHPRLLWWYIRHGLSPYDELETLYERLNEDEWKELLDKFVDNVDRREWLEEQRDRYKNGDSYWIVEHECED